MELLLLALLTVMGVALFRQSGEPRQQAVRIPVRTADRRRARR